MMEKVLFRTEEKCDFESGLEVNHEPHLLRCSLTPTPPVGPSLVFWVLYDSCCQTHQIHGWDFAMSSFQALAGHRSHHSRCNG